MTSAGKAKCQRRVSGLTILGHDAINFGAKRTIETMSETTVFFFDVWAKTSTGGFLHFELIAHAMDPARALDHAREWLDSVGHTGAQLGPQNLTLCHQISPIPPTLGTLLRARGWAVIGLEGCSGLPDCASYPDLT